MKTAWFLAFALISTAGSLWAGERVAFQKDGLAPHVIYNPHYTPGSPASDAEAAAREYIRLSWERFKLEPLGRNVSLYKTRHSLTGVHYYFRQIHRGYPIESADLIVSVGKSNDIMKVFNTTAPVSAERANPPRLALSEDDALDVSWRYLGVQGEIMSQPGAELAWRREADGRLRLIQRVALHVNAPDGAWSLAVDAATGEVISAKDTRRYRLSQERSAIKPYEGHVADRREAMRAWREREGRRAAKRQGKRRASGTAFIFDPDPRTFLGDESLRDDSLPSLFDPAFVERPLRDITLDPDTGLFSLEGPYAEVRDFESPTTQPTTTADGVWDFPRGNNGLNDAMTYYHVDENQRYLQSLGYTGERAVFNVPILLDTDGVFGNDQSYYVSSRLSFGHGCVDDNEDADVIIHEYGHAIQDWIHGRWDLEDRDEGAMGEGFCDYWAGSYTFQRPNGASFFPNQIFQWDGLTSDFCAWGGRVLNRFNAEYNFNIDYFDHVIYNSSDGGSFESDELWSTPLFQAMLELYRQGVPVSEADAIVIESHFGLGDNLKMPTVAESTVNAARTLHPNGPHALTFQNSFSRHQILAAVDSYEYISAHVPPNRSATDWESEIYFANPNSVNATVRLTVYESDDANLGAGSFTQSQVVDVTLTPGESSKFEPDGENQRWVHLASDQPLSGTSFFRRNPSPEDGEEIAGIPLFSDTETGTELILPHVPANRVKFWSGAVVLNPNDTPVNLSIELYGASGTDLSNLVSPGAPTVLDPRQKWVTFLAEGPNGEVGVFDDSGSAEKVSWVKFIAGDEIAAFQLYGYKTEQGEVATAGIMAAPDQRRTHFPIRAALTDVEWAGFSILNPTDENTPLNVKVLDASGAVMGETDTVIPPRRKLLGLNQADGFSFPSNNQPLISFPSGSTIQTVVLESPAPLRVFELNGDLSNTQIDGGAVFGTLSRAVFTDPDGKLELFNLDLSGDITVTRRDESGQVLSTETVTLANGASRQIEISGGDTASVEVRGERFTAAMVDRDGTVRSLTAVNGKQVEFNPNGQD